MDRSIGIGRCGKGLAFLLAWGLALGSGELPAQQWLPAQAASVPKTEVPASAGKTEVPPASLQPPLVPGQGGPIPIGNPETTQAPAVGVADANGENPIVQTGCSSCGSSLPPPVLGMDGGCGPGGCGGGCNSCCYPGRTGCDCCCDKDGPFGRLLCGLYQCICCPDPCYEPRFVPLANAAFFVDGTRPVTQLRLRTEFGWDINNPDKAEWFWAQENAKGPHFPSATGTPGTGALPTSSLPGGVPGTTTTTPPGTQGERKISTDREFFIYSETAIERFSFFVEMSYRNFEPASLPNGASGLGDMNLGTKSLLLDCELTQVTFQFKTFLPTGDFTRGLGTGHVSLEPSLLAALKLTPKCYLQGEVAYWFPIGGSDFAGTVFHYHGSLNYLLCSCGCDVQLISTLECGGYEILNGQYTDPLTGEPERAVNLGDIFYLGGGLRLSLCNKIDFGIGAYHTITENNISGKNVAQAEFRWRF